MACHGAVSKNGTVVGKNVPLHVMVKTSTRCRA